MERIDVRFKLELFNEFVPSATSAVRNTLCKFNGFFQVKLVPVSAVEKPTKHVVTNLERQQEPIRDALPPKVGGFRRSAKASRVQSHLPVRGRHSSPIPTLSLSVGLC